MHRADPEVVQRVRAEPGRAGAEQKRREEESLRREENRQIEAIRPRHG
jgi:hypothetical protein